MLRFHTAHREKNRIKGKDRKEESDRIKNKIEAIVLVGDSEKCHNRQSVSLQGQSYAL